MNSKFYLVLVLLLTFVGTIEAQDQGGRYQVKGPGYIIEVQRVVKETQTSARVLYVIQYSYEFSGRALVYNEHLGTVSAKGRFSYVTADSEITFWDLPDGKVLVKVPVRETDKTMGAPGDDFLNFGDFPLESSRPGTWRHSSPFADRANTVVARYYSSGFDCDLQRKHIHFILTKYRTLSGLPSGLIAQVALLLSYPDCAPDTKKKGCLTSPVDFRVQWSARERNTLTPWRKRISNDTDQAIGHFLDRVIAELSREDN